ncbi:MAG: DUF3179 domain-containing (seleno)protein [Puia sp.]|nr:DUF3179 domain-containing (seleno)protein [Puia sp.]
MNRLFLVLGILLLFALEILRVYFIMPFPGSQRHNTIGLAWFISRNIVWMRLALLLLLFYPVYTLLSEGRSGQKIFLTLILVLYGVVFYFFNARFEADKMFYQPGVKIFAEAADNKIDTNKLVIGVVLNGEARAFPIDLIGYHHQVVDTIGQTPVMITYCTVCRTGRAFSPFINGKREHFRLVGMDHFNAMFEDNTTKSWWQQATGEAVAGPLKGQSLTELPSIQCRLGVWLRRYPHSLIMQPDPAYAAKYAKLADYDQGTLQSSLEKRDSGDWHFKSWVIGIRLGHQARTYNWNDLTKHFMLQDRLDTLPILLTLEKDTVSFHAWNRNLNGVELQFERPTDPGSRGFLMDTNTHSTWNEDGLCIDGSLKGSQLQPVQSYQEFLHSWEHFHPGSQRYHHL